MTDQRPTLGAHRRDRGGNPVDWPAGQTVSVGKHETSWQVRHERGSAWAAAHVAGHFVQGHGPDEWSILIDPVADTRRQVTADELAALAGCAPNGDGPPVIGRHLPLDGRQYGERHPQQEVSARGSEPLDDPVTLSVRWVTDAVATPPAEPEPLVAGMIRRGELCVIGAPRGIGKSWLAANLGVLLGRGDGRLGGTLKVERAARVLIAQGEIDEWESSRRWAMLTGTGTPPDGVAETFDRWRIRTIRRRSSSTSGDSNGRNVDTDEWVDAILDPRLEATIAGHRFDVIVIDPWAVFFAGAENSNDETEAALDKLRDLAMRYQVAVVILHHLGKSTEAREPEDLWRGASRLADWASTRITVLPHWTDKQAADQGMTRAQARRYVDVRFLRRSTPTDDFAMRHDPETGWWEQWTPPEAAADARRIRLDFADLVHACQAAGGSWPSTSRAATDLGVAVHTAAKILGQAATKGVIEPFPGARGANGWRIPGHHLTDPQETP